MKDGLPDDDTEGFRQARVIQDNQRLVRSLRFREDRRFEEACRLLCSSHPIQLRKPSPNDLSEVDIATLQIRLQMNAQRTLALPVGRGALTLGTAPPLPIEPLPVPSIMLAGRLVPGDAQIDMDLGGMSEEALHWPSFHNGAAVGLRAKAEMSSQLTRTWVLGCARSRQAPANTRAGVLLGLGLRGQLRALWRQDVAALLPPPLPPGARVVGDPANMLTAAGAGAASSAGNSLTGPLPLVGLAIGLGASHMQWSTLAPHVDQALRAWVPSLAQSTSPGAPAASAAALMATEQDVPRQLQASRGLVRAGALIGLGLLHCGTAHRWLAQALVSEELPCTHLALDDPGAPCHATAAGLALGLVTLGRGGTAAGLADAGLEGRLWSMMRLEPRGDELMPLGDPTMARADAAPVSIRYRAPHNLTFLMVTRNPPTSPPLPLTTPAHTATPLATLPSPARALAALVLSEPIPGIDPPVGLPLRPLATGQPILAACHPNPEEFWAWRAVAEPELTAGGERGGMGGLTVPAEGSEKAARRRRAMASARGPALTAAGATVGLGLMYLRTNNPLAASRLALPQTPYLLEFIRPELVILRDDIRPTVDWVQSQAPPFLVAQLRRAQKGILALDADLEGLVQSYAAVLAGSCLAIGLRYAGSHNPAARTCILQIARLLSVPLVLPAAAAVDGAMKTGAGDEGGSGLGDVDGEAADPLAAVLGRRLALDRHTLDALAPLLGLAAACVMSGTGDLPTFRYLRWAIGRLRPPRSELAEWVAARQRHAQGPPGRPPPVVPMTRYGQHMAIGMAVGWLHLGGSVVVMGMWMWMWMAIVMAVGWLQSSWT
ncbi:putative anaphase-promoting complex subunit 1 [Paratrimastix pyriformis]|uniref:Anaphase-promoting complex subunit 1 n=1 Tax=Paratrimastix pyriformis TaxID=342808 RepID=A0ABQ8UUQ6_9EUKA|nr:putative anaphase-promoting complex subunit 1 [Paratrimastix pyriformis]